MDTANASPLGNWHEIRPRTRVPVTPVLVLSGRAAEALKDTGGVLGRGGHLSRSWPSDSSGPGPSGWGARLSTTRRSTTSTNSWPGAPSGSPRPGLPPSMARSGPRSSCTHSVSLGGSIVVAVASLTLTRRARLLARAAAVLAGILLGSGTGGRRAGRTSSLINLTCQFTRTIGSPTTDAYPAGLARNGDTRGEGSCPHGLGC